MPRPGVYKAGRRQSKRIPRFIVRHAVKDEEENYREFKNTLFNSKEGDCIFLQKEIVLQGKGLSFHSQGRQKSKFQ